MERRRNLSRRVGRRTFIVGGSSALIALPNPTFATATGKRLLATPRQSKGPYYPVQWGGDVDNDLVRIKGREARALGQVVHINGIVMDMETNPIPDAVIEIWQVDSRGVYLHPTDNRGSRRVDSGFQGRGRTRTGRDGSYSFRTIRPVAYPGRTPHIHFRVAAPKRRALTTQMYIAGEPLNEKDSLLNSIRDPARRDKLIVKLSPIDHIEPNALRGYFDIVLF